MNKSVGAIYYSDFHIDQQLMATCLKQLKEAFAGEIVSVSLDRPVDLGTNIVLTGEERGYSTMVKQIITALENLTTDHVYFLEHDVLYHARHFDFTPPRNDTFYYNANNWRWLYPHDYLITYSNLISLSMLCCSRELAFRHYQHRLQHIHDLGLSEIRSKDPKWARKMGYEPGTKPKHRGGFSDDVHEKWRSELPNIDIRHRHTFSPPKVHLQSFKHPPEEWREAKIKDIPGWNLREIFEI